MTTTEHKQTEPFALVAFLSGIAGFFILPIVFAPITWLSAIASYYRFKQNKDKYNGNWMRIVGAILGVINILYLRYVVYG